MHVEYTLENCSSGGWKASFPENEFSDIAERVRDAADLDVDSEHMLLWHDNDIKISLVKSSGVMTIRTEDRDRAEQVLNSLFQ